VIKEDLLQSGAEDGIDRAAPKHTAQANDFEVPTHAFGTWQSFGFAVFVVLRLDADQSYSSIRPREFERNIACCAVFQVPSAKLSSGRPLESDGAQPTRGVRPPISDRIGSKNGVCAKRAEQIEAHGHRRQEVRIQSIRIERLLGFWLCDPMLGGLTCAVA
jgi:hypothetical protein